jgi:hypothetical protein
MREAELRPMLQPYIDVTDRYGVLISSIVLVLGKSAPSSNQDSAIRDLMADVFDHLYEARHLIIIGKPELAYPLARRGYESLSLVVACNLDEKLCRRWMVGKHVSNEEVRRTLAKHPKGESEAATRRLYKEFSEIAHPNRSTVAHRLLGEGNEFVLGSVGKPSLVLLADYALKTLDLWYWFGAFATAVYLPVLGSETRRILDHYHVTAEAAKVVSPWLSEQYNRVLAEEQDEMRKSKDRS